MLSAQNLLIEQWTASTVDQILSSEDRLYLDAYFRKLSAAYYSQALGLLLLFLLHRFKLQKNICIDRGSQIFIVMMLFCFVIDVQM